jgi:hypothetical protein
MFQGVNGDKITACATENLETLLKNIMLGDLLISSCSEIYPWSCSEQSHALWGIILSTSPSSARMLPRSTENNTTRVQ